VVGAVAGIAIWAGLTGLFSGKESLTEVKDAINFGDAEIQRTVVRYTEPDIVHDRDANLKALAVELRPYGLGLELSGEGALSRVVPAGPATGSQGAKP
jgi:hypothetical protein